MKTKIHAIAGGIAFLTILSFWTSTLFTELFTSHETVAMVKGLVLKGMFILIPAMMIVGASGMSLGGKRQDAPTLRKKKRMPIIAVTGLLVLLPAAFYLENKASNGSFDTWFYIVQAIELIAGASNLRLIILNIRDGLRLTGKISDAETSAINNSVTLKAQENGALMLKGSTNLIGTDGSPINIKKATALCRCGASKNKPFCDGSHNKINFNDSLSSERTHDEVTVYKGESIDIHYNKLLCSHAGVCGVHLQTVFDAEKDPWINPDNGKTEEIKSVVKDCPSGALSYSQPNEKPQHLISNNSGIKIEKNGPYHVNGISLVSGAISQGACPEKYVLCRCGASKNKPYCDGSHVDIEWKE